MSRKLQKLCLMALLSVVSTTAWALSEVDGVYQIGSAEDYQAFVELVNGGNVSANAILTADIDLGTFNTKVGSNNKDYVGTFDGAGHTITIDLAQGTDNEGPALFHSIGRLGLVTRLKVQGTLHAQQYKHAAAIANYMSGVIRDCWVDILVESDFASNADASIGGIVGQMNFLALLENCLSKIKITGATTHRCGGLAAWVDAGRANIANCLVINDPESDFDWTDGKSAGLVRYSDAAPETLDLANYNADSYHNRPKGASANNYVTNDWGKLGVGTTLVTPEEVASGKVCYQLNSDQSQIRWKQVIGTDAYPVPAVFCGPAGQVYASGATDCQGKAEGELTYSNDGSVTATPHTYDKWGVCTTCGQFNWNHFDFNNPEKYDPADKSFLISSGTDLFVAETWNRFQNGCKFNLKLTDDVECKPEPGQVIFNTSDWIESSLNGQGHTLTIEMVDITEDYAALFPKWYLSTGTGAVLENLVLHGTISTAARNAGSICGRIYGNNHKVRNVFSDVTINATYTGDCSHGGFIFCGGSNATFDNCIYAGDINGVEGSEAVAGFCGWANGTNYFNNCAFLGTINNFGGDTQTIARNPGTARCTNVYSLHNFNDAGDTGLYTLYENEEGVENGELAYLLNGKQEGFERFYQTIGTDPMPSPIAKEGALVYSVAETYGCDGKPIGDPIAYSNTPPSFIPSHQYADGMCTICGQLQEGYMTTVDGWYEIGTPAQLMWWANWAATHLDVSAKLTADIDMEEYCATYPDRSYPQIGNETAPFYGNFDGQYHTISNLNINLPGKRGAGLIGVMSSQPSSGFGGLSAEDARAAEGVFVKNVVLDETCSIYGQGYTGVVGMSANWPGHITISGVLNKGDATVDGGTNGAGLFGCAMGSACHITITGCGFIGKVHVLNNTKTENGLFSGWLGTYAEVTNCFALGTIDAYPDPARSWARHPNNNTVVIKNCYGLEGSGIIENDYSNNPEDVTFIPAEEVGSGALAWKANGKQFREPLWFQTLKADDNPTPIPTHGTIIYGAEQYFSAVTDEDIETIAPVIQAYEEEKEDEDIVATQALLDAWKATVDTLTEATTIADFADVYDNLEAVKAEIAANAAVYQSYIDKCAEVLAFLEGDKTFEGSLRNALEYYLSEDITEGPDENNPLGTYGYIIENHVATAEEIEAEIARIDQWLQDAIAEDYKAGTDVSRLIPNSDFAQKNTEHWTGAWCNAYGEVENAQLAGSTVVGVEAWNRTGDMYQTVEGMKPGYYLVGVSGAFRPSNNRYSTNYAAGIYANGIFNYFPTVVEDYVAVADTIDQVNCNLHGLGALDLEIYDDNFSTSEEDAGYTGATLLGFAVHGPYGMAAAANVGRYQAYTIAHVGEDGLLTIGIKSQGTKYGNDWTGWGPIKVTYWGEEADGALDDVLENMTARAETIIDYQRDMDEDNPAASPNFPAELKDSLQEVIDAIDGAGTVEAKAALVERFSDLFQRVYAGKRAYIDLYNYALLFDYIESGNLPLVEKGEDGEWNETGEMVFSEAECEALYDASTAMLDAFNDGSYSLEEAQNPATALNAELAEAVTSIMPNRDGSGYYLISNPKQLVTYRALVINHDRSLKAKLVDDVDMTGIGMQPFGNRSSGTSDSGTIFTGVFDGQNHALENVYINFIGGRRCALFYELQNATVKNLKLTGEYHGDGQRMGGLTGWTSGTTRIENCEIAVVLYSDVVGDGTHGGVMGVNSSNDVVVENCLINCTFVGENTHSVGGVCGWSDGNFKLNNSLILSQYSLAPEPSSYPSDVITRNKVDPSNVFYAERSLIEGANVRGTLATAEQLASGEITYRLNNDSSDNPVWFQTIGTDAAPRLFDGLVVYYRNGVYMNAMKGDVNVDTVVDIADAVSVLNAMAGQEVAGDADVNGDGTVDIADLVTVLNIMAGQ